MEFMRNKYFTIQKINGTRGEPWVQLSDFKKPVKLSEQKRVLRKFAEFEKELFEAGFFGWVAYTSVKNAKMIKLFDKLGAKEYAIYNGDVCFQKEILEGNKMSAVFHDILQGGKLNVSEKT